MLRARRDQNRLIYREYGSFFAQLDLSSTFHHIGIAVSVDGAGTVWMTQDFSN